MLRHTRFVLSLFATLSVATLSTAAFAQIGSNSSSVAFVYVSSSPSNNNYEINAFAVAADGKLSPVSGSPFSANVQSMAVNQQFLFGTNGIDVYSFSIAADGSLQKVAVIDAQKFNGSNCGGPTALFLDHTGSTLYDEDVYGNICANNTYQSFSIDQSTGELNYLGASDPSVLFSVPLSFIGKNVYAYGSSSHQYGSWLFGFKRNSGGKVTDLKINPPMPVSKKADFYVSYGAAADSSNHVAISVTPYNQNTWLPDGPPQFATYTADRSGHLTTQSTYSNMPATSVQSVADFKMSPSGKLLAVGGTAGLQVFHFNGANPVTHYTGLIAKDEIDQIFWDNDNHLYAISRNTGKLLVFTITSTGVSQAPGSPYPITNPQNVTVLPRN